MRTLENFFGRSLKMVDLLCKFCNSQAKLSLWLSIFHNPSDHSAKQEKMTCSGKAMIPNVRFYSISLSYGHCEVNSRCEAKYFQNRHTWWYTNGFFATTYNTQNDHLNPQGLGFENTLQRSHLFYSGKS